MAMDDDKNVYLVTPADLGPPMQSDDLVRMMNKLQSKDLKLKNVRIAKAAVFMDETPDSLMRLAGMNTGGGGHK
jgi:hypothetical protein